MPNLSQQFTFALGTTGTVTATTVLIPSTAISPYGTTYYGTDLFISNALKGDGYYGSSDGVHTVTYTVGANFCATMKMQATLAVAPEENDWFDINDTTVVYDRVGHPVNTTATTYINFTGNFVWVRANIVRHADIPHGSLLAINYNH